MDWRHPRISELTATSGLLELKSYQRAVLIVKSCPLPSLNIFSRPTKGRRDRRYEPHNSNRRTIRWSAGHDRTAVTSWCAAPCAAGRIESHDPFHGSDHEFQLRQARLRYLIPNAKNRRLNVKNTAFCVGCFSFTLLLHSVTMWPD